MRRALALLLALASAAAPGASAPAASNDAPPASELANGPVSAAFAEPGISPDGKEIAFVSGGDIWSVPAAGGDARLLLSDGFTSKRPLFSPDGKRLAFVSDRAGHDDLYALDLATAKVKRLTFDATFQALDGWSRDGSEIYFSTFRNSVGFTHEVFRVSPGGGTPMPIVAERYVDSSSAAPSPDGATIAYVTGGEPFEWWRRGHAHIDESRIALFTPSNGTFRALSPGGAVETWPMWAPGGRDLYYVSDRSGAPNLDALATAGGAPRALTHFTSGRVLWPSIALDGRTIAFERDFGIWVCDTATGDAHPVAIALRGAASQPAVQHLTQTTNLANLALSPDGKKLAFTTRGRVFAAAATGGDAIAVTTAPANASELVWSPDSTRLAYISDVRGDDDLYLYDFRSGETQPLTHDGGYDYRPAFAPDGKSIAYVHARGEVRVVELATGASRVVARGQLSDTPPFDDPGALAYSPDGTYLAYESADARGFAHVDAVPARGGNSVHLDYLANTNLASIVWSPDGTRLFFQTSQRTEPGQIASVDLIERTPPFREDQFRKLFSTEPGTAPRRGDAEPAQSEAIPDASPSPGEPFVPAPLASASPFSSPAPSVAPAPARATPAASPRASSSPEAHTRIEAAGIQERTHLLPTGIDASSALLVTPDGKTLVFAGDSAGQTNLYTYSIDELADAPPVARQLTATSGAKRSLQLAPDGKAVYYLDGGRAYVVALDGSAAARPVPLAAALDADFESEKLETFAQVWGTLAEHYADPNFNGVDWRAVRDEYAPFVRGAHNEGELVRLLDLMVGELDSSHSGVAAPPRPNAAPNVETALGLDFDRAAYDATGELKVAAVVPLGPAALTHRIQPGDVIQSVDGTPIGRHDNVDGLLENRAGKRTVLRVDGRDVVVMPRTQIELLPLRYRAWVATRRALVDRLSGGKLGYVHLFDMGQGSLEQLYVDLDTTEQGKAGVVVDIRNNDGGFVDPYALDVFARKNYIRFRQRGSSVAVPERSSLGQRLLDKPTVLLVNEHSLSDAENFAEDYRRAHLGEVIGIPTAGWIIFTSSARTIDGTNVRVPGYETLTLDGTNMERHPRPVDLTVQRVLGEDEHGGDAQLEAAVRALMRTAGSR